MKNELCIRWGELMHGGAGGGVHLRGGGVHPTVYWGVCTEVSVQQVHESNCERGGGGEDLN